MQKSWTWSKEGTRTVAEYAKAAFTHRRSTHKMRQPKDQSSLFSNNKISRDSINNQPCNTPVSLTVPVGFQSCCNKEVSFEYAQQSSSANLDRWFFHYNAYCTAHISVLLRIPSILVFVISFGGRLKQRMRRQISNVYGVELWTSRAAEVNYNGHLDKMNFQYKYSDRYSTQKWEVDKWFRSFWEDSFYRAICVLQKWVTTANTITP